ncbi:MAG: hypothetical protein WDZ77_01125 [Candidatus Pacearchaeota archaeon]
MNFKDILKITGIPVLFASLCCLTPIILVLFGLGSLSFAASLADNLYGNYKWAFRSLGLLLLALSLFIYFRSEGICTIKKIKSERRKIINTILVILITAIIIYVLWLYFILEIVGILLGIWSNPFS